MANGGAQRVCIFCGEARPLTKTHLIAQRAIRRYLPLSGDGVQQNEAWIDEIGFFREKENAFNLDPLNQYVKRACEPCNRDWMGGIEKDVAQTVIGLALGNALSIGEEEAQRLAVWAASVAVLRATQSPGETALDADDVLALRATSELPPGWLVWLISMEPKWTFSTRHQRYGLPSGGKAHVTYFVVGHAAFLVTHPELAHRLAPLNLLGDAVQLLHPSGAYPLSWPPRRRASVATLLAVTDRFAVR